jgi:hypothetical protein
LDTNFSSDAYEHPSLRAKVGVPASPGELNDIILGIIEVVGEYRAEA